MKSDEVVKKYFLIYEGSDTEVIYFDAVRTMRESIGINPLIELIPIIRSFSEEGWSNPKKILDRVIENLRESKEQFISYESLLNRIMDYLYETKVITTSKILARNIWKTMLQTCDKKLKKSTEDRVDNIETSCKILIEDLREEYEVVNIVEDISEIIKDSGLTYEEGFDQICLIVDRGKDSFISTPENNQYKYVLDKCNKMGFQFCVTNTTPGANEALVKQTAIERCKNRFVLADYSKFGCISSVTFSAFVNAKILTDNCPAEFLYSIVDIFIFYTISQIFEVWL